jgi:AraC family transcriptional regulator
MSTVTEATRTQTVSGFRVRRGVDEYRRLLGAAGGTELATLMRGDDHSAVCAAIYVSPPYDLQVPPLPVNRLSVNLTRARVSGGVDGERHRTFEADRYSIFFAPAGAPMTWRKESPSRHLTIFFHPDAFDSGDEGESSLRGTEPIFNASAPGIRQLADQLADELDGTGFLNADAADSLARLLLVRFARHMRQIPVSAQPLTSNVLSRLREYVVEHLSERLLVADLAKQVGMQPNRFAATYSEQTGQSPHQFVLTLRIENATELLRDSNLSLADVALGCGFANQQHLTNAMRRYRGITPSRYRAEQRSEHPSS